MNLLATWTLSLLFVSVSVVATGSSELQDRNTDSSTLLVPKFCVEEVDNLLNREMLQHGKHYEVKRTAHIMGAYNDIYGIVRFKPANDLSIDKIDELLTHLANNCFYDGSFSFERDGNEWDSLRVIVEELEHLNIHINDIRVNDTSLTLFFDIKKYRAKQNLLRNEFMSK
jgi:hypothetical protein